MEVLSGDTLISGAFTQAEASAIASQLRVDPLPLVLTVTEVARLP